MKNVPFIEWSVGVECHREKLFLDEDQGISNGWVAVREAVFVTSALDALSSHSVHSSSACSFRGLLIPTVPYAMTEKPLACRGLHKETTS